MNNEQHNESIYQPVYSQRENDNAVILKGACVVGACFILGMTLVLKGSIENDTYTTFMGAGLAFGGCFLSLAWMAVKLDRYNEQVWEGSDR